MTTKRSTHTAPTNHNVAARIGRWSVQHRRKAIVGWLAFVFAALVIGFNVVPQKELEQNTGMPSIGSRFFCGTRLKPTTSATNTKASHPKTAFRRCWTLQRPTRAARLWLVCAVWVLRLVVIGGASALAASPQMRLACVRGCGLPNYSKRMRDGASRMRSRRAGTPATTAFAGTSRVTTAFVPTTALSPIVTPRRMQAP